LEITKINACIEPVKKRRGVGKRVNITLKKWLKVVSSLLDIGLRLKLKNG